MTARWRYLGLALGVHPDKLDVIERENQHLDDCLMKTMTLWLMRVYDTQKYGKPSWELLAKAVGHRVGGKNPSLAEEIIKKHGSMYDTPTPSHSFPYCLCIIIQTNTYYLSDPYLTLGFQTMYTV